MTPDEQRIRARMAEIRDAVSAWDPDDGEDWADELTAEYVKLEAELRMR